MNIRCTECGKKILPNKDKCLNCGAPIKLIDEKEFLKARVEKSKKIKKILIKTIIIILAIVVPIFIVSYLAYEFLPNGEEAYYCDEGYTFYAVGKLCVNGDNQYKAKIKKLNNHTRYNNNISFQFVFDENNEVITFMGSNCFGDWSDEVKTTFCYDYEDMSKYEEFNKMNDYKNLSEKDRIFIKINGIWSGSHNTDKFQFTFYPDNKKCKITDIENRRETMSCEFSLTENKINLEYQFSDLTKSNMQLSYNNELTELYYDNTTYIRTETLDIKTTGFYWCDTLGYTLAFSDGYNVILNESCKTNSHGTICPYYEGTYSIDGNVLRISVADKNAISVHRTEEFIIVNENEIVARYNKYSYIWEPAPYGFVEGEY